MKQLTYFKLNSNQEIRNKFNDADELIEFLRKELTNRKERNVVFLFTYEIGLEEEEGREEIFVTDEPSLLFEIISNQDLAFWCFKKFHLHEYKSFEDAYAVALNMREVNELCYG